MPRISRRRKQIPQVQTARSQTERLNASGGISTYPSNDVASTDTLAFSQDARIPEIGKYTTRHGARSYSVPIGETATTSQTVNNGSVGVTSSEWIAQSFNGTGQPITKIDLQMQMTDASGVVAVALFSDIGGSPDDALAWSSVSVSDIGTTMTTVTCSFIEAPSITGTGHIVVYMQEDSLNTVMVGMDTGSTGLQTSNNLGSTWTNVAGSIYYSIYTATAGGVKGLFRAKRSGNPDQTFMAHGSSLYTIDENTGATTVVGAIDPASTDVYFQMVDDAVFYTDGVGKPRKYDFATDIEITDANRNARNVIEHHEHLFYMDTNDLNRAEYTEAGNYETHPTTHFRYFPTFKTNDPIAAWNKLNGLVYVQTLGSMYVLYGTDTDTWQTEQAPSQIGTYSQESTAVDDNYIYFASDEGIHRFDGASAPIISLSIQDKWDTLLNKQNTSLEIHDNRLYVHYTPNGSSQNTKRLVYNTLLNVWESDDTRTYFDKTYSDHNANSTFYVGSNRVGAVYIDEDQTNDYNNLGGKLDFEIRTHYDHFGAPSQLKDVRNLEPRFESQARNYEITVSYSTDRIPTANKKLQDNGERILLGKGGALYDTNVQYDSGAKYDGGDTIIRPRMHIGGDYYSIQRRYSHSAAREPVCFIGETLEVWTARD